MTRRRKLVLGPLMLFALLALRWTFCGTLPEGAPHARVAPLLDTLPPLELCWAEFGRDTAPGFVLTTGWSRTMIAQVTVSGLVIKHPSGTWMIDSGDSSQMAAEIAELSGAFDRWYMRQLPGSMPIIATAPVALRLIGVDPASMSGVLLSHAHVDHAGGMVDLPGVPALLSAEELAFVEATPTRGGFQIPAHARTLAGRMKPIEFKSVPYEVFDRSADLFGDGSVVVVPLPGHTPGSVGVFVNVSASLRILHIGDTTMVKEGFERPAAKGFLVSLLDNDRAGANELLQLLKQLHDQVPELVIMPAHDRKVWEQVFGEKRCRLAR